MTRAILVVDDPAIRRLIGATLDDVAGDRLREAGDGEDSLEAAVEDRPEIVFLDHGMPLLDGVETCRRLRSDPAGAGATIVMLTGTAAAPSRDRAAAGG